MKIKCISLLLIAFLFTGLTTSAQSWLWGEEGSTGIKALVSSCNIATNNTGNVYQTGGFTTSIRFGTTTLSSSANEDAFLVKYGQNGNVIWARQSISNGSNSTAGYSVATDDSDNSYIIGFPGDTTIFGTDTLYGDQEFLIKYDPNGNIIWVKQPSAIAYAGYDVVTDKLGHEYVTGEGLLAIKFDRNGNIIWTFPLNGNNNYAGGNSIATDISGNVYVCGTFINSMRLGTFNLYSESGDLFIAKLDSSGNVIWAQQSVSGGDFGPGCYIAADPSGAAYLTGCFIDTISFGAYTFLSPSQINGYNYNFFVVKYNSNGNILWGNQNFSLISSSWFSSSVCTDDFNNVYISGSEGSSGLPASFEFANDKFSIANPSSDDIPSFLLKLDSWGNVICGSMLPGGGIESNNVTSDATGKFVYLGGAFTDSLTFGSDDLIDNTGGMDSYVGRWQPCFDCDSETVNIMKQGNVLTSTAPAGNQWLVNNTELEGATSQTYTITADGWYKVIYTNPVNGCTYTSDSIYVTGFSTETNTNCLSIYPNPTFNTVFVKWCPPSTGVSRYNLKVIDELGRMIYYMPSMDYSNEIDLTNLPAAMYFFVVTNSTGRTVTPIVKLTN